MPARFLGFVAIGVACWPCLAGPLRAQERPSPQAPQQSPRLAGFAAFGEGRYDEAIRQFRLALERGDTWDLIPGLIETIEARRRLGVIVPADTHRIGIIWVTDIYRVRFDGGRAHQRDITEQQKPPWQIQLGALRATIEAFSGGRWTLAFDEVDAVATYPEGSPLKPPNPDHLNLERYFLENTDRHDTYITFSNTTSPQMGLARRYPVVNGVLYGPHRGMVAVSYGSLSILLHEFFHAVEWVSDGLGGPVHGWREPGRSSFPLWRGTTEFDYYRWHFATTLRDRVWRTMNHTNRWRLVPSADRSAAQERILAAYAAIPLTARQEARELADSARRVQGANPARAAELLRRALALSPYAPEALLPVYEEMRERRPDAESLSVYARRLTDIRAVSAFVLWDSLATTVGAPLGAWWPEQLTRDGVALEWDATAGITAAGPYVVTLLRRTGRTAVTIEWVTLLEDGGEVARQTRRSSVSHNWPDQPYELSLPAYRVGARYTVRAHLTGVNGTDSHGIVLLRRK